MNIEKAALRAQFLKSRRAVEYKAQKSMLIMESLLALPAVSQAKIISCYANISSEVQTTGLISKLRQLGKVVYEPIAVDLGLEMQLESKSGELAVTGGADLDVVIVPGVAFSRSGARLGRGKGYYDRFLSNYPDAVKIGLAFSEQISEDSQVFPQEAHDVHMDMIVTESEVIKCA